MKDATTKSASGAQSAQEALARVNAMAKAGERRNAWAHWPAMMDTLLEGLIITPIMFAMIHYPSRHSNWLIMAAFVATVPSIWLRVRVGMRSGVLMRSAKRQIPWTLAYWTGVAAAIAAGRELGWLWTPWVMAAALMIGHYCLRRTGRQA